MKLLFCLSQAYAISWLFVGLSLFTTGSPTQAEHFLPALGETMKWYRPGRVFCSNYSSLNYDSFRQKGFV